MTLLKVSNVPPDLSFTMISKASLCAGSRASVSFNRFCIVGNSRSRTLAAERSATKI
ncbi:hypothetical protein HanRHA438_Chr09g0406511 [Helianthus annuus]|nr:hypothetical protein HanIR_Chr09g0425351 [Helianthus annuus]KAJ0888842.1 hypothetical protein HanRHA438_Chr09g0406511 [Helianthus annuus]